MTNDRIEKSRLISFQIAVYLTLCVIVFFLLNFLKRYLSCGFITSNFNISRVFKLILVKLFKIVYIIIRQGAPLGLAVQMN